MTCKTNNPAVRQFLYRFVATMLVYAGCIVVAVWSFVHQHPTGVLAYLLAVLPALPIIAMLALFGLYLREEKDEFQRTVLIESMLWSIGATLAVTTVWGFLENFVQVPHLDLYLVFPLFCFFVGISRPLLKMRYR
jgi:xanthosine utilization system XapX-like protein